MVEIVSASAGVRSPAIAIRIQTAKKTGKIPVWFF